MLFMFLNLFIGVILVISSFQIDRDVAKNGTTVKLVNLFLLLGVIYFLMGFTLFLCMNATWQLALIVGRTTFMLSAWFAVMSCGYMLQFPNGKITRVMLIARLVLFAVAAYIMFMAPNGFNMITITYNGTLSIASGPVLPGKMGRLFPLKWFTLFNFIFRYIMPGFTCLMVLVRAENSKTVLEKQNLVFHVLGVLASFLLFIYINFVAAHSMMLISLSLLGYLPAIFVFAAINRKDEIWDRRYISRVVLKFLLFYFLPTLGTALSFYFFWPLRKLSPAYFFAAVIAVGVLVTVLVILGRVKFADADFFRDSRYADDFEKEITSIKFDTTPEEVTGRLSSLFMKYLDASSVKILIDNGDGVLEQAYSSDDSKVESLPVNSPAFDTLMNMKRLVVFRDYAQKNTAVASIRQRLMDLFDRTESNACILLTEGRQLIGVMLLGKKNSGNIYSEYDYNVLNRFYSNLFVVGYYMKNIMNEAVVGTVNREIRMSGQIITSIQENMDLIKSDKVDAGYLMVPAHNIGGEFVDMIRLTDTRHIFVIGALSGKGIAASMGMVILKSIIRTFLAETTDFKKLVEKVNLFIRESLPKGTYFAGAFGLLDFNTDTLYYINCGTPAIFVYTRAYNNVIEIQGEGHVLGFVKDISDYIKVKKVKLANGDIILTCTDGLVETRSLRGEIFGKPRVQQNIMENTSYPAERIAKFSYEALLNFSSKELDDDITMLVLKYLGKAK